MASLEQCIDNAVVGMINAAEAAAASAPYEYQRHWYIAETWFKEAETKIKVNE